MDHAQRVDQLRQVTVLHLAVDEQKDYISALSGPAFLGNLVSIAWLGTAQDHLPPRVTRAGRDDRNIQFTNHAMTPDQQKGGTPLGRLWPALRCGGTAKSVCTRHKLSS